MSPTSREQDYGIPFTTFRSLIDIFGKNVTAFKLINRAFCDFGVLAAFLVMITVFYDTTPCRLAILLRLL